MRDRFSIGKIDNKDTLIYTSELEPETIKEAIELVKVKWQILEEEMKNGRFISDGSLQSCALCRMFINKDCKGCPVALYTGSLGCEDTPYPFWLSATKRGLKSQSDALEAIREIYLLIEHIEAFVKEYLSDE